MPYNTAEGQLVLDVNSNKESFEFTEVQNCEPLEYSDKYLPSKYGAIFKEKLYLQQTEGTNAAFNIKLLKDGQDFGEAGLQKDIQFDILDNGEVIYSKKGINQINLSHFYFRSNAGLPESS